MRKIKVGWLVGLGAALSLALAPVALQAETTGMQTSTQHVYSYPSDQGAGGWNFVGATVGVASSLVLKLGNYSRVAVQNTSATASMACAWGSAAVLNSSGSFQLAPGQVREYGSQSSSVPQLGLSCIASAAATPLYIETH